MADDRATKLDRLRAILDAHDSESIRLTSVATLSWLLDGARVHVASNGPAVLAAEVTRTDERIVCAANEAERLIAEQLPAGLGVETVPWHTAPASALQPTDDRVHLDERDVADTVRFARSSLLPAELGRYRELCRETAMAVTATLADATPATLEIAVAAQLTARLVAIGAEPLVVLVGGATRLCHRHPLPTDAAVGQCVMLVVCARRHGMIANLTRWRCFSVDAYRAHAEIAARLYALEAEILAATRPGAMLSSVFGIAKRAYLEHGFADDEWTRHHQGGPTGYVGRDPKATDTTHDPVVARQALAWNPSAPGAKVEDTVLTGATAADRVEVLTVDPHWPTVEVNGLERPDLWCT